MRVIHRFVTEASFVSLWFQETPSTVPPQGETERRAFIRIRHEHGKGRSPSRLPRLFWLVWDRRDHFWAKHDYFEVVRHFSEGPAPNPFRQGWLMSLYDAVAPKFDRHRAIPAAAVEAIRAAMLAATSPVTRPRFLDIGAGTGRIGLPFVAARNDYVGVDSSLEMLYQFARRSRLPPPCLVQSDGQFLPFRDASFDAVMLIQIFGQLRGWRQVLAEGRRVLRPTGALFVGRSVAPATGLDAQMKQHLALILSGMDVRLDVANAREDVLRWLNAAAESNARVLAATWDAERTPREFLERHRTGASFSVLPVAVKEEALSELSAWAAAKFGSLDAVRPERHVFELRVFRFREEGVPR
jgi:ubiquinone/menaquinone biosynthesis C-methylase UbiE